ARNSRPRFCLQSARRPILRPGRKTLGRGRRRHSRSESRNSRNRALPSDSPDPARPHPLLAPRPSPLGQQRKTLHHARPPTHGHRSRNSRKRSLGFQFADDIARRFRLLRQRLETLPPPDRYRMRTVLIAAISLDGFITRHNQPGSGFTSPEDKRYFRETVLQFDTLIFGSANYEFSKNWISSHLRADQLKIVLTRNPGRYTADFRENDLE